MKGPVEVLEFHAGRIVMPLHSSSTKYPRVSPQGAAWLHGGKAWLSLQFLLLASSHEVWQGCSRGQ